MGLCRGGGINAMVLFKIANSGKTLKRKVFLKNLTHQLFQPHMERRLNQNLPRQLAEDIMKFLGKKRSLEEHTGQLFPSKLQKQSRCHLCPRADDKKVKTACTKCGRPACSDHRKEVCVVCCSN